MNNSAEIPQIGFGMWQILPGFVAKKAVKYALEAGYSHFDTAQAYHNEQHLGSALKDARVKREDVFITTKIRTSNLAKDDVVPSFEKSLEKLQTDYVDLLLIHFPVTEHRREAWRKLEEIYESKRARAIGVSNYTVRHLEELLKECKVKPAANQVELHIYLQQAELVEYCQKKDIVVEAYSPLARGHGMDNPVLVNIAKKHGKTTAQIMIRWCVDIGTIPLPKSTHKDRIKENIEVFDFKLDSNDMKKLKSLDKNMRTNWDPTNIP